MYGYKAVIMLMSSAVLLAACGGGSSNDTKVTQNKPPEVNQATGFAGSLVQNAAKTERYIRNGIYASALPQTDSEQGGVVASPSADSLNYSTTNTIESGVDEADRVKYDGDTFYLANYAIWSQEKNSASVRVLTRNEDDTLTSLPDIELANESDNIIGMYRHQKHLVAVSTQTQIYPIGAISILPWEPSEPKFSLQFFDVSNPADVTSVQHIEFDGSLLSTRRIGDDLYIASSFVPYLEQLIPLPSSDADKLANYQYVSNTASDELMPNMYSNGQATALNELGECYVPEAATENDGYAQILTVTRININQPSDIQSMCMSAQAYMLYMSLDSMYLASNIEGRQTAFHKIGLTDLSYQASGVVDGVLGWRSDPLFKVDESEGYLRVVTTDYSNSPSTHHLSVLTQNGNELETVATLPNQNQSESIGKPGEDVYAVRFIDDQAYIVTFETIDPLYVIDLTDNTAPSIMGSLEIPGFSSYLHPLENGLLLGIGQQVSMEDIPDSGDVFIAPPTTSGMKISLFDIRDAQNPVELKSIVVSDAYTPVEFNYKALSVLEEEGHYQFALPVESWGLSESENGTGIDEYVSLNSLMLLEVDSNSLTPDLLWRGNVGALNASDDYIYAGEDRSIIHAQNVYYFHGNQVWQALWSNPANVTGPF
ncbi:beta-propeller domain-containing protein [Aliiglaciecola lipolytica]|uniref:Beta propeller domain-containing protein n=1 Tax=Aliiglaciecola lipolytica E3 TaxID=1127673 RepID=K6YFL3_9ALTE|nr:beta-propeller domain-containing protein [Aliiglaciecola lipolytica]GAC15408.1 hypothetical protein GLIP_2787 [Aliiglaciecola lipolytica E3]